MHIFQNGVKKKMEDATLHVDDFGFSRAVGLYELTRVYGCKPFMLDAHMERLQKGLHTTGIVSPISINDIKSQIKELVAENAFDQSVAVVYVTQGKSKPSAYGVSVKESDDTQVFVMNKPFHAYSEEYPLNKKYYEEGISLKTINVQRYLPEVKTTNYTAAVLETTKWQKEGYDDIAYLSVDGFVKEASRSNLIFVKDGALIVPAKGVLGGITKRLVVSIAEELNIPVKEGDVHVDDLSSIDECFATGSASELIPVNRIDDHVLNRRSFVVYERIWEAFKLKISAE